MFIDISRAHPHADIRRVVYITTPDDVPGSRVKKLIKNMYGLKDAPQNFELKVTEIMLSIGAVQGLFSSCVFLWNDAWIMVHGDDFFIVGDRDTCNEFANQLRKSLIVKVRGFLCPQAEKGDIQEIIALNRILRWRRINNFDQIEIEGDPRHAALIISHLGLQQNSKGLSIPSLKQDLSGGQALTAEQHTLYRSVVMRAAFLAEDRPDLKFPTKELARMMSSPTTVALDMLKRLGRYLIFRPRLVQVLRRQRRPDILKVYSDSDFAGCPRTRRSTSATVAMIGTHTIKVSSTTQGPIALSSGESEWYGIVKSATIGLGLRSLAKDFGCDYKLSIVTDSSAANGVANRRGAGGIRHIETRSLWLQQKTTDRSLTVGKISKKVNWADLPTKHQDAKTLDMTLAAMGFESRSGKSSLALDTT
jgi:hypothetical protein